MLSLLAVCLCCFIRSPSSPTPVAPESCALAEQDTDDSLDTPKFQAFLPILALLGLCCPVPRARHTHPVLWVLCSCLLSLPPSLPPWHCPARLLSGHLGPAWFADLAAGATDAVFRARPWGTVFLRLSDGHSPSTVPGEGPCCRGASKTAILSVGRPRPCAPGGRAWPWARSQVPAGLRQPCGF